MAHGNGHADGHRVARVGIGNGNASLRRNTRVVTDALDVAVAEVGAGGGWSAPLSRARTPAITAEPIAPATPIQAATTVLDLSSDEGDTRPAPRRLREIRTRILAHRIGPSRLHADYPLAYCPTVRIETTETMTFAADIY